MTTDRPDETLHWTAEQIQDALRDCADYNVRQKGTAKLLNFAADVIDEQRRLSAEKDAKLAEARDTLSEQSAVIMRLEHSLRDVRDRKDQRIVELVQAQSHWQPIATAPTDGSEILGFMREWDIDYLGCLRFYRYDDGSSGWRGGSFRSDPLDNWTAFMRPTHWMPLPAKPTEAP